MATLNSKPYCVALTGGIASGKTSTSNLFAKLGVPIIDADIIARELTEPKGKAYHPIVSHFGKTVLNEDNTLNRRILREIIFNNISEKTWLENLLHPLIREQMRLTLAKISSPYCICVIPLLAESNNIDFIDRVLVVTAPKTAQLSRATKRDQSESRLIEQIIEAQANSDTRLKIADDIINNDHDIGYLETQILKLHELYLSLSK